MFRMELRLFFTLYFDVYAILKKPVWGGTTTNRIPFRFCHPPVVGEKRLELGTSMPTQIGIAIESCAGPPC